MLVGKHERSHPTSKSEVLGTVDAMAAVAAQIRDHQRDVDAWRQALQEEHDLHGPRPEHAEAQSVEMKAAAELLRDIACGREVNINERFLDLLEAADRLELLSDLGLDRARQLREMRRAAVKLESAQRAARRADAQRREKLKQKRRRQRARRGRAVESAKRKARRERQ